MQQQIRSLVGRKTTREGESQNPRIEYLTRALNLIGGGTGGDEIPRQSLAGIFDQRHAGGATQFPECCVRDAANVLLQRLGGLSPAILTAGLCPQIIGSGAIPGWRMHTVGHVLDGHLVGWPAREKWLEKMPAHLLMQTTDAVDCRATADCEIGHIEALRSVLWVLAPQGEQILKRDTQLLTGVVAECVSDETRSKAVEAGWHGRVGSEEITRACGGQRNIKRLPAGCHKTSCSFQHSERRVSFI